MQQPRLQCFGAPTSLLRYGGDAIIPLCLLFLQRMGFFLLSSAIINVSIKYSCMYSKEARCTSFFPGEFHPICHSTETYIIRLKKIILNLYSISIGQCCRASFLILSYLGISNDPCTKQECEIVLQTPVGFSLPCAFVNISSSLLCSSGVLSAFSFSHPFIPI